MKSDYQSLIPSNFSENSRVWVYQCSRMFTLQEVLFVESILEEFINGWQSHGTPVRGFATVFYGQFIIIMADEEVSGVSGCSTDASVRMIKKIESDFGVSLFDRTQLAFWIGDKVQLLPIQQLKYALENGFLTPETLFFDHSVHNKASLSKEWIKPVKESWLASRYNLQ